MKQKLKKLAKKEMKKRNLTPKASLVTGAEIIKTFKSFNRLPYLPKAIPNLQSKSMQNKAQSFYFVQGSYINNRTNAHIREVLQKREGSRVIMGGIVSGFSAKGVRVLIEFPRTLHVVGNNETDVEIIDSHLWLEIMECTTVWEDKSRTVSLGDFLIVEGEAHPYFSKGEKRYSLKHWGIVRSGLLASREGETLNIIENYSRIGWIFKQLMIDYETDQGEIHIQRPSQIIKDKKSLTDIFKRDISFHLKKRP